MPIKNVRIKITFKKGNLDLKIILNEIINETIKKTMSELYLEGYNDVTKLSD